MQFAIQVNVSSDTSLTNRALSGLAPGMWLIALGFSDGWGYNVGPAPKTFTISIEGSDISQLTGQVPVSSDVYVKSVFAAPVLCHVTAINSQVTLTLEDTDPSTGGHLSGSVWVFAERVGG